LPACAKIWSIGWIVRLQLDRVVTCMRQNHSIELRYVDAAVSLIAARCAAPESGGRMIDAMLTNTLLPQVGRSGSGYSFE
jgi:type VI secretion system protein VasG